MTRESLLTTFDRIGMGAAVLLGLSIPVSTGLDSVLTAAVLLFWILGLRYREKAGNLRQNPVVLGCFIVLFAYLAGIFYSSAPGGDIGSSLSDARIFLLIPLLMTFFSMPGAQKWGLNLFTATMVVILVLSYLLWLGLLPEHSIIKGDADNPVIFKLHISHNILMAFSAYLFAVMAWTMSSRMGKLLFGVLSIAALFSVFYMVTGRTGQVAMIALMLLFLFQAARWRGIAVFMVMVLLISGIAYVQKDNALHQRSVRALQEIRDWDPERTQPESDVGERLDFYRGGIKIMRDNLLWGVGTGGFKEAYKELVAGTELRPTTNPHNEYLMVGVQLGFFGLLCYALLFGIQWRYSSRLENRQREMIAKGLIVTILTASLTSSTLMDHTEGLFYAWMTALLFAGATYRRRPRT